MEIKTIIACPYQCRTDITNDKGEAEYTVCSKHGICVADPNAGFVRCLCDSGWTGINCDEIDSSKPTKAPTESPSNIPTLRPTRYPTFGYQAVNATEPGFGGSTKSDGGVGLTVTIIILVIVIICFFVIVYFGYKKFKQREAVLRTELDEYKSMGNEEKHDLNINKQGIATFTTIDDHIANDKDEDEDQDADGDGAEMR